MFSKLSKKSQLNSILLITMSNIGDVVMAFPAMDVLLRDFPQAKFTVVVGPKPASVFHGNPHIHELIEYDKHQSWAGKLHFIRKLREQSFENTDHGEFAP